MIRIPAETKLLRYKQLRTAELLHVRKCGSGDGP